MAYINAQEVAKIRSTLKEAFPDFKFRVRKQDNSSVYVTLVSGPVDLSEVDHYDINPYWYQQHFPQYETLFTALFDIIKYAGKEYFNKSDLQSDYHHVAFYYHLHVGSYNTPYEQKIPKKLKGSTDWAEASRTALAFNKLAA